MGVASPSLRQQLDEALEAIAVLRTENEALRDRIAHLEAELGDCTESALLRPKDEAGLHSPAPRSHPIQPEAPERLRRISARKGPPSRARASWARDSTYLQTTPTYKPHLRMNYTY